MSENPLVASDLLLGGHVTIYSRQCIIKILTVSDTNIGSSSSKYNYMLLIIRFLGSSRSLVTLDVMSDDFVTGYASIFRWENMKNYNLLLANWKILNIFYHLPGFGGEKSNGDVKFAVRRPCDKICRHYIQSRGHQTLHLTSSMNCLAPKTS